MDYNYILDQIKDESLFDLYRLQKAINVLLENPQAINHIKAKLKKGEKITFFDRKENMLVPATIVEVKKTQAVVTVSGSPQHWLLPIVAINIDSKNTDIKADSGLDRNSLKIGDNVGFLNKDNEEVYGTVIKLNPKSVGILTSDRQKWKVSYELLFAVIDGFSSTSNEPFGLKNITNST